MGKYGHRNREKKGWVKGEDWGGEWSGVEARRGEARRGEGKGMGKKGKGREKREGVLSLLFWQQSLMRVRVNMSI